MFKLPKRITTCNNPFHRFLISIFAIAVILLGVISATILVKTSLDNRNLAKEVEGFTDSSGTEDTGSRGSEEEKADEEIHTDVGDTDSAAEQPQSQNGSGGDSQEQNPNPSPDGREDQPRNRNTGEQRYGGEIPEIPLSPTPAAGFIIPTPTVKTENEYEKGPFGPQTQAECSDYFLEDGKCVYQSGKLKTEKDCIDAGRTWVDGACFANDYFPKSFAISPTPTPKPVYIFGVKLPGFRITAPKFFIFK